MNLMLEMNKAIEIGLIGDYDEGKLSHQATTNAIHHAANCLSIKVNTTWIPTTSLLDENTFRSLDKFSGLWGAPGSPYRSLDGALRGIRFARENRKPFLGTCSGFQHALLEYARNVAGLHDAGNLEYSADVAIPLIVTVSCPIDNRSAGTPLLSGALKITLVKGSLVHQIYG